MFHCVTKAALALSLCLTALPAQVHAQEANKAKKSAETNIQVSAPLAQAVVVRVKAKHDDIVKLGLHAVPPG